MQNIITGNIYKTSGPLPQVRRIWRYSLMRLWSSILDILLLSTHLKLPYGMCVGSRLLSCINETTTENLGKADC